MTGKTIPLYLLSAALLFSCGLLFSPGDTYEGSWDEVEEVFDEADEPSLTAYTYDDDGTTRYYWLQPPWNYDKDYNSSRDYPIVVSLHGSGGTYYAPCIVGDEEEMQEYPCFFLAPHSAGSWGDADDWARTLIEELKEEYRIDEDRIYLIGFSMGGSGSYKFAHGYEDEQQGYFAGIVRLAGASQTTLSDGIADVTSVWYHVGLTDSYDGGETNVSDDDDRISVQAYNYVKNYSGNSSASQDIVYDTLDGYDRKTKTLTKNGIEIMKLSHYTDMGHSSSTAWKDPDVLEWLFDQSLDNRE
ncbi:MAG: alpha/beta hydrolase [Spirochaetales bacterium]|nr:alpha/beta hydrolase [Spirochaetales bacterium]